MATEFVNKHMTRTLAAGATDHDVAWLTTVDAWLTSNSRHANLLFWTNPAFGVIKNGSNHISKIFDLGCTRLPRGGDYTPESPANTTYSATGLNSTTPAEVNASASLSKGYYGSARGTTYRWSPIRRKHHQGVTMFAAYQSGNANQKTFIAYGEGAGFSLANTAGSPGQAQIKVSGIDIAWEVNSVINVSGATSKIIAGTFDGLNAIAYSEGTAGTPSANATQDNMPLLGPATVNKALGFMGSGSKRVVITGTASSPSHNYINSEAQFTISDRIVFDDDFSATEVASLTSLLRTRIGA
jgi:hypothetical protein